MSLAPVSLGARHEAQGLLDLLRDCHARIRKFSAMAVSLATVPDVPDDEARDAARAIARYFRDALPLHVADEEHSIAPRLRGHDPAVDVALAGMLTEHAAHGATLSAVLSLCDAIAGTPDIAARRAELEGPAAALAADMEAHLAAEESTLFPAIAALPAADQAAVVDELRARRGR
jgi:iron-sulfur cluster repair protein YtfE (RIC family)